MKARVRFWFWFNVISAVLNLGITLMRWPTLQWFNLVVGIFNACCAIYLWMVLREAEL